MLSEYVFCYNKNNQSKVHRENMKHFGRSQDRSEFLQSVKIMDFQIWRFGHFSRIYIPHTLCARLYWVQRKELDKGWPSFTVQSKKREGCKYEITTHY